MFFANAKKTKTKETKLEFALWVAQKNKQQTNSIQIWVKSLK